METRIEKTKNIERVVKWGYPLIGIVGVSLLAFSRGARREVRIRAGYKSEISGRDDMPLDASHIIHARRYPKYNDPTNGVLMTIEEHLWYHEAFEAFPRLVGLSYQNNQKAVNSLRDRLETALYERQLQREDEFKKQQFLEIMIRIVGEKCRKLGLPNPFDRLYGF